jgi:hypothetical protein
VADQDPAGAGATPDAGPTPEGARPDGQVDDRRDAGGDHDDSDTQLRDRGRQALERERTARREAEQRATEFERRLAELEDAGKTELERATARADRSASEADTARARVAELERELAERDVLELKRQIAQEVGIPFEAAHRLQGSDARSIRADANRYLEERGRTQGDLGVGRGGAATGRPQGADMNQLIREASGRS